MIVMMTKILVMIIMVIPLLLLLVTLRPVALVLLVLLVPLVLLLLLVLLVTLLPVLVTLMMPTMVTLLTVAKPPGLFPVCSPGNIGIRETEIPRNQIRRTSFSIMVQAGMTVFIQNLCIAIWIWLGS